MTDMKHTVSSTYPNSFPPKHSPPTPVLMYSVRSQLILFDLSSRVVTIINILLIFPLLRGICVFHTTGNDWKFDMGSLTCAADFCVWFLDTKTRLALIRLHKDRLEWIKKKRSYHPVLTWSRTPTSCFHRSGLMTEISTHPPTYPKKQKQTNKKEL